MSAEKARSRIVLLDALRGAAVLNMAAYHGIYDWVYVFGKSAAWFTESNNAYVWEQCIAWTFILVSGAVSGYSRRPYRRAAVLAGCALLLTAVTVLLMPSERILFGVLHFLAAAVLLTALARPLLDRVPAGVGAAASFALFLLTKQLPWGFLGLGDWRLLALPQTLYTAQWTFPLGLIGPGFYSADYFPVLPWLFLFWTGRQLWRWLQGRGWHQPLGRVRAPAALCWTGRQSLLLYLLHQPLLLAMLWLPARFF